jgi:hypothetical protein
MQYCKIIALFFLNLDFHSGVVSWRILPNIGPIFEKNGVSLGVLGLWRGKNA